MSEIKDSRQLDLRELRGKTELNTTQLAAAVGVVESTVRNWETGRTTPTLPIGQTLKLCELYGVNLKELVQAAEETRRRYLGLP